MELLGPLAPYVDADIVAFGSPGMDVDTVAADLESTAEVWAARAAADWIGWVPKVRVSGPDTDPIRGNRPSGPG